MELHHVLELGALLTQVRAGALTPHTPCRAAAAGLEGAVGSHALQEQEAGFMTTVGKGKKACGKRPAVPGHTCAVHHHTLVGQKGRMPAPSRQD